MSEFKFGGDLRWMGFLACNALHSDNYDSMINKGVLPITDEFHLLLSGSTTVWLNEDIGRRWAEFMIGSNTIEQKTVKEAWFSAGINSHLSVTNETRFRVSGWESCHSDSVTAYTEPDPEDSITFDDRVVAPFTP